MGKEAADKKA